jgi:hypothetical protein
VRDPSGAHPTATRARPTIDDDAHTIMINRVAWGAIFAGVVVALVVQVLLTMLGAGIGMATLDPASTDNPAASTFSITAAIWCVVSGAMRGLWTAKLHRQQTAIANEMIRQTIDFWTRTGMAPIAGQKPKRRR